VSVSGYATWSSTHFTADELLDPARSGPLAVYAGDGVPNLVKYALGIAPSEVSADSMPEVGRVGDDWVFTYVRPSDRPDLTYEVQVSLNLTTWTTNGVSHVLVSSEAGMEVWAASVPASAGSNVFFRLKVTQ